VSSAALPAGVAAGQAQINFAAHQVRAGVQGAREDFESMISQLVRAIRPGVRMIAANPGDWGIDVLVGDLGGAIAVWQSKYFVPEVEKSHQQQIRESFDSVCKNAEEQGCKLHNWTLCVPSSMDGPTAKWWDTWKKRKQREKNLIIELWDETELRGLLISPDADNVRRHFYEPMQSPIIPSPRALVDLCPGEAERLDTDVYQHIHSWLAGPGSGAQVLIVDNAPPVVADNDVVVRFTRRADQPPYGLISDETS